MPSATPTAPAETLSLAPRSAKRMPPAPTRRPTTQQILPKNSFSAAWRPSRLPTSSLMSPCLSARSLSSHLLGLLHYCHVCLGQVVGDRDDREDGRHKAREGRREHEPIGEEGGDPMPDAEHADQEFTYGLPPTRAAWLFFDVGRALHLLILGKRGADGARDGVVAHEVAQLVGRYAEEDYV